MYHPTDLLVLQRQKGLSEFELELCCMIANRFTDEDLHKAYFKFYAYKRKDTMFPSPEIKAFIVEICNERNIKIS